MEYLHTLLGSLLMVGLIMTNYATAYPSPVDNHLLLDYGYGRNDAGDQIPFLDEVDYGADMKSKRARFGKRPKGGSWEDVLQELSRGDRNLDFSRLKSIRFGLGGRR
ncbi:uncharacterized protein LOC129589431 isoform X2 [Paramacrobiotus metropolitanus]|uniref:uncharacterized protein LOC129589431 isoform X2 n=1 Tax=Paramacrobiotus metropolitanus TaxID=2943436 RepID=UPI002445CB32|nr:uncharacterized protein LOC129589431 isoform X2 [Paramacrobiotus metropolitanus]